LGLSPEILARLQEIGYMHPTPIQQGVIPAALDGQDVIGLAETGSGKTAAFCLPALQALGSHQEKGPRAVILAPTREIALQTQDFVEQFRQPLGLRPVCLIGGVKLGPQITALRREPDLVVATPGRFLDHWRRRNLHLGEVGVLVLDEADHMLDLGFLPQVGEILEKLPKSRQSMMFSATLPDAVERLARRFLDDPVVSDLRPSGRTAEGIHHHLYLVSPEDKKPCLLALVREEPGSVLVFMRRKMDADWACRQLELDGHPVDRIHSDRSQSQRVSALKGFRQGEHRVLVATDIAARGLDIPRIEHIINFDIPETVEDYVHRAGRTARGAAEGTVSTIATWRDRGMIEEVEKAIGQELQARQVEGVEPYRRPKAARSGRRRRLL
jgi:ATP-dependent RNA helicase RhlE